MSKVKLSFTLRQISEEGNLFSGKPYCSNVFCGLLGYYSFFSPKNTFFFFSDFDSGKHFEFLCILNSGVGSVGDRVDWQSALKQLTKTVPNLVGKTSLFRAFSNLSLNVP